MKKILLLLFTVIALHSGAQSFQDTVSFKNGKDALLYMRDCLGTAHERFAIGGYITLGGAAMASIGIIMNTTDEQNATYAFNNAKEVYIKVGSAVMILGGIQMILSHRHIGKAGRWNFTPQSVIVTF